MHRVSAKYVFLENRRRLFRKNRYRHDSNALIPISNNSHPGEITLSPPDDIG